MAHAMRRDDVLRILSQHHAELEQFNIKSLALFGSVARDQATPESDLDVLVEFKGRATSKGYFGLMFFLEDLLDCKVDLVTRRAAKPLLRAEIERDLVHVA